MSGLFQALFGQAAELPEPRLNERKQTLSLIDVDAVGRHIPIFVDNCSVVTIHLTVRLEAVYLDLSQQLGEVFSHLNHWLKITSEVDTKLTANHAKRVAARRDERQLVTVASSLA